MDNIQPPDFDLLKYLNVTIPDYPPSSPSPAVTTESTTAVKPNNNRTTATKLSAQPTTSSTNHSNNSSNRNSNTASQRRRSSKKKALCAPFVSSQITPLATSSLIAHLRRNEVTTAAVNQKSSPVSIAPVATTTAITTRKPEQEQSSINSNNADTGDQVTDESRASDTAVKSSTPMEQVESGSTVHNKNILSPLNIEHTSAPSEPSEQQLAPEDNNIMVNGSINQMNVSNNHASYPSRTGSAPETIVAYDPHLGKIVYEIVDAPVACNACDNLKTMKQLREQQLRELHNDKQFYIEKQEKDAQVLKQEKESTRRKKETMKREFQCEITQRANQLEHEKRQEQEYRDQLNRQFQLIDEQVRKEQQHKIENEKRVQQILKSQMHEELRLKEMQRKQHQAEEEAQPKNTSLALIPTVPVISHDAWVDSQGENVKTLRKQIQDRLTAERESKMKEREEELRIIGMNQAILKQEKDETEKTVASLRKQLNEQWQESKLKAMERAERESAEKRQESNERMKSEMMNDEARKRALLRRTEKLLERKAQLDNQLKAIESMRNESIRHEKQLDQRMVNESNSHVTKRVLYRCPATGKVLPPEQFNSLLTPSAFNANS